MVSVQQRASRPRNKAKAKCVFKTNFSFSLNLQCICWLVWPIALLLGFQYLQYINTAWGGRPGGDLVTSGIEKRQPHGGYRISCTGTVLQMIQFRRGIAKKVLEVLHQVCLPSDLIAYNKAFLPLYLQFWKQSNTWGSKSMGIRLRQNVFSKQTFSLSNEAWVKSFLVVYVQSLELRSLAKQVSVQLVQSFSYMF